MNDFVFRLEQDYVAKFNFRITGIVSKQLLTKLSQERKKDGFDRPRRIRQADALNAVEISAECYSNGLIEAALENGGFLLAQRNRSSFRR